MSKKRKPTVLQDKWTSGAMEVPEPRTLELRKNKSEASMDNPFPLPIEAQKRLLELIYNRNSGIITRQELIDVLFNQESTPRGSIIRCRL
jgi:hypothetical protein